MGRILEDFDGLNREGAGRRGQGVWGEVFGTNLGKYLGRSEKERAGLEAENQKLKEGLEKSKEANQALEDSLVKFRDTETVKTQLEAHLKAK